MPTLRILCCLAAAMLAVPSLALGQLADRDQRKLEGRVQHVVSWESIDRAIQKEIQRLNNARTAVPVSQNSASSDNQKSKLKPVFIGAAIGGGVGAIGGAVYGEATKDGTEGVAIPIFAGIGAGVGALAGLVIALF